MPSIAAIAPAWEMHFDKFVDVAPAASVAEAVDSLTQRMPIGGNSTYIRS